MVTTTSPAMAQANDNEKKRRQTMEKAKANHLSRQLQMRLQYARLKVEHGWQKQTLNEVENLYFHHSHQRGPKPFQTSSVATTTHPDSSPFASQPPNTLSSLSFISRNATGSSPSEEESLSPDAAPSSFDSASASTPMNPRSSPQTVQSGEPVPEDPSLLAISTAMDVDSGLSTPPLPPNLPHPPISPAKPASHTPLLSSSDIPPQSRTISNFGAFVLPLTQKDQGDSSPLPSNPANDLEQSGTKPNHYPNSKPSRSRSSRSNTATKAQTSLTAKDMFNFASTSASSLTYDSFWSSHSPSRGSSPRDPRGSLGNAFPDSPGGLGPSNLGTSTLITGTRDDIDGSGR